MASELIKAALVYALPDKQHVLALTVEPGTTALQAAEQSGIVQLFPQLDLQAASIGIFNQLVDAASYVLQDGDRVEIYRPLICDPKASRQARAEKVRGRKWRAKH